MRQGKRGAPFIDLASDRYNRKNSNAAYKARVILTIILVACGLAAVIIFGYPLIEDLIRGVDPMLRYKAKVEKEFNIQPGRSKKDEYKTSEMYITSLKTKNEPYISDNKIIFTTRLGKGATFDLDAVAIYDTDTDEVKILPNVQKKYDNLLSPILSGDTAVWIDSLADGGGRIVGYDLNTERQFLIKEYAYSMPVLSLNGNLLSFMQWAGDSLQRLYIYDINTREAATVRLYDTLLGNSPVDISDTDLVWSEYRKEASGRVTGTLKRIVFTEGSFKYDDINLNMNVFEPKTNGKDIIFTTTRGLPGDLMLSVGGNPPTKVAEGVLNYDLGDNFIAYTKDDKIHISFTDRQKNMVLTSDISKNQLASVNGNKITYYDVTDGVSSEEVVKYATIE